MQTTPQQVTTVHVVFKTHLDIGYTDLARNVINTYHTRFFPQALATAQALRDRGGAERMIWTAGAWLISEHLALAAPAEPSIPVSIATTEPGMMSETLSPPGPTFARSWSSHAASVAFM